MKKNSTVHAFGNEIFKELCRELGYHHRVPTYNPCLVPFQGLIWNP